MKCNYCGKELNKIEATCNSFKHEFGYGSKRDGDVISFMLCDDCYDKLTDKFIEECKVKPMIKTYE